MPADSAIPKTQNSFYWEESTVDVAGAPEDLTLFRKHCNALRELINHTWAKKQTGEKVNSANFASLVLSLKELNRRTQFRIRKARERTSEQKFNVDKLHLNLQNLLYEVAHLENDIKTCLEFKSQHEKLNLIPLEEFCEATGRPNQEQLSHEETLERLYWELEQRKSLSASCEELMQSVESISQEIAQKQKYLTNFAPKLKELVDNTLVIQKLMDLPFTKEDDQHRLAFLLPAPLYILYAHLKSYLSMMADTLPHTTVEIEGDGELAKAVNQVAAAASGTSASPDVDDSDTEDAIAEKKRKAKRHKGEGTTHAPGETSSKMISMHPLRVVLRLVHSSNAKSAKTKQEIQLTLSFAWIAHPGLVTVRMRVRPTEPPQQSLQQTDDPHDDLVPYSVSASDLLRSESLLFNLCTSISRPDSPIADMPALPAGLMRTPVQWNACESIGRPYLWAQQLAGLQPLPELPVSATSDGVGAAGTIGVESDSGSNSVRFEHLNLWLHAIHRRLADRVNLIRELTAIEAGQPSLSLEQQRLLPPSMDVRLANWKRSTMTALENVPRARKLIALQLIQHADAIFQCEFHRINHAPVPVWVAVPPEYPNKAPLLVVDNSTNATAPLTTCVKKGAGEPELSDLHLQDLEAEVNCYWSEFFPGGDAHSNTTTTTTTETDEEDSDKLTSSPIRNILSCQLARCAACLYALGQGDVSASSSSADSSRVVRYPTRSRPLRYLPSLGAFTHR